jgi:gliding motility-associated-like protein
MRSFITLVLLLSALSVVGQRLHNQSTIYISSNGLLYVSGDIVNNNMIINNGDMQVGGTWTNNGTYDAGTGKITFNSDLPQTINHNAQSFSRLTISGGGVKNFPADITIEDELNLTEGTLVSQNGAIIVFSPTAQIIGGSDQAHINGPVYHQGSGTKIFPVGNGTDYLPVEITGIASASEVGITLVEFSSQQSFSFKPELSAVSGKRYWEVDVVSGSLAGTQLVLPLNGDEGLSSLRPESDYVVVQSLDSPIEFTSLGQSALTGSLSSGSLSSLNAVTENLVTIGLISEGIVVYNAVSADGNDLNASMKISNITAFPNNKVSIFNRWGDKVWEVNGYDNEQKVFTGNSNQGGDNELPAGTYFYVIDKGDGSPVVNGFVSLKR